MVAFDFDSGNTRTKPTKSGEPDKLFKNFIPPLSSDVFRSITYSIKQPCFGSFGSRRLPWRQSAISLELDKVLIDRGVAELRKIL